MYIRGTTEGQTIFQDTKLDLVEVREGRASVLVPRQALKGKLKGSIVFYNPLMELNRDLSVLALESYRKSTSHDVTVLDAMTGCGIRGIRYAMEVQNLACVALNDIRMTASNLARQNVEKNRVEDRTEVTCSDANLVLALHSLPHNRFDVVDLDPFGSPAPFLDSAVRAASDNGLIALTATDMPPLCGIRPKAALKKYGGRPLRTEYCHEIGLRLLVGSLVSASARHDMGMAVKFAHSTDHYFRVYATVQHGGTKASQAVDEIGFIAHCFHCLHREVSTRVTSIAPNCRICGHRNALAGPLWLGKLHEKEFCRQMLDLVNAKQLGKRNRIQRLLGMVLREIENVPTYYRVDRLSDRFQTRTPKPETVVKKLQEKGYSSSLTHFHGYGVKTDADPKILEQIIRELSQKPCA